MKSMNELIDKTDYLVLSNKLTERNWYVFVKFNNNRMIRLSHFWARPSSQHEMGSQRWLGTRY